MQDAKVLDSGNPEKGLKNEDRFSYLFDVTGLWTAYGLSMATTVKVFHRDDKKS